MVRDFQRVIGDEARLQLKRQAGTDAPDVAIACVGGGSNAIGLFTAFLEDRRVRLIGVEAGGRGIGHGEHAARFAAARSACCTARGPSSSRTRTARSPPPTRSRPASTTRRSVPSTPMHDAGRVEYTSATDEEAIAAFHRMARTEGIIPALESAHAVAEAIKRAPRLSRKRVILVNLSGRGDKDVESVLGWDREHAGNPEETGTVEHFAEAAARRRGETR